MEEKICYCDVVDKKIDNVILVSKGDKLWKLGWRSAGYKPIQIEKGWERIKSSDLKTVPILSQAKKELEEYLAGDRQQFDVPLLIEGTDFRKQIWEILKEKVLYGETVTYSELGKLAGKESSVGEDWHVSRAIGSAMGKVYFSTVSVFIMTRFLFFL